MSTRDDNTPMVRPFAALRPPAAFAAEISCPPYDVVYDDEARRMIEDHPDSFIRVTLPEADFPLDAKPTREEILAKGRTNLERLISNGTLRKDETASFYVYRLTRGGRSQTGIIGCCSIDDYEAGNIKRHEFTRPDKVEDRTEHMIAVGAQTGLIFLAFRGTDQLNRLIETAVSETPEYHLESSDDTTHELWPVTETSAWQAAFDQVPTLYVADGHHRLESAKRAREILREQNPDHNGFEEYNFVIAGIFPAEDLRIMAYNRVVYDLNGMTTDEFFARLSENFVVRDASEKAPSERGGFCMYLDGRWYHLWFNVNFIREPDPIDRLDVSILQSYVLAPLLGIEDPRTDKRIAFVGGSRGVEELERLVDSGTARVAFSMFPTTMEDLFAVSDMGEVMPPKSTWFEPKLRDGLTIHLI